MPTFAPMQFNTAVCFLLSSIGLLAVFRRSFSVALWFSVALLLLSGLSGMQYLVGLDFGIDELFVDGYILVKTSHAGRMAPNTALSFVLTGVSLLILIQYLKTDRFERLFCTLSSTLFLLGAVPFIGYLMNIETAYGWGYLTRMAVHTSFGFVLISFALLLFLFFGYKKSELLLKNWIPILSSYIILIMGIFLWSGLHHYQIASLKEMVSLERVFLKKHIQRELDRPAQVLWQGLEKNDGIDSFDPSRVSILFEDVLYKALENRYNLEILYQDRILYKYFNSSKPLPDYAQSFEVTHADMLFKVQLMPVESLITKFNTSYFPIFALSVFIFISVLMYELIKYAQRSYVSNAQLTRLNQLSMQHVENLTGVLSNIAELDFSKKAEITGENKRFDAIAEQVNLVSDQLSKSITEMDEKNRLLRHLNGELERQTQEVDSQRLAALNIAADIRVMLEKTEVAEQEAKEQAHQLEQSNNSLQEFARIVSHDLQEPLRKVLMYSDRVHKGVNESGVSKVDGYLEKMKLATKRMQQLISDILHYSRVTSVDIDMAQVDMKELIEEVLDDFEVQIDEAYAVLHCDISGAIVTNRVLLKQLLQNLVGNALKFHKPGEPPEVTISGAFTPSHFRVSVKDNGVGFEQEHAARIFEIFQRLQPKGEYKGTGIGLTICKKIAQRLNGSIEATSEPGIGSEFTVLLPLSVE